MPVSNSTVTAIARKINGVTISAVFLLLAAASIGWHLFSSIRSRNAPAATLLRA